VVARRPKQIKLLVINTISSCDCRAALGTLALSHGAALAVSLSTPASQSSRHWLEEEKRDLGLLLRRLVTVTAGVAGAGGDGGGHPSLSGRRMEAATAAAGAAAMQEVQRRARLDWVLSLRRL
jgi:hypothetical protein